MLPNLQEVLYLYSKIQKFAKFEYAIEKYRCCAFKRFLVGDHCGSWRA